MTIKKILIFDTSIASENVGDSIIVDSVLNELHHIFNPAYFLTVQTHDIVGKVTYRLNKSSDYSIVAGSNLLSSNMNTYNQWKINILDAIMLNNIILMGVGWWQYQRNPNLYTKILYKSILSKKYIHSVRDEYTKLQLNRIGFKNVLNTCCPTMWKLSPSHCKKIPHNKSKDVIFTLTDYKKDFEKDKEIIKILKKLYNRLYFWPQGTGDHDYLKNIDHEEIYIIDPNLVSFDNFLSNNSDIDYVGTRLHAGIRAMKHLKRSLILAVDNRSTEINKDTNIPVLDRNNVDNLVKYLESDFETVIKLPQKNINDWSSQFKDFLENSPY